jgi:hypothetical protein
MIFNLCLGLLAVAYLLRVLRRYEACVDAIITKLDKAQETSMRRFDAARDEIRVSMRTETDRSIAMMQATIEKFQAMGNADELQDDCTENHMQAVEDFIAITESVPGENESIRPKQAEGVPTEAEIELLPQWARVAFAARCARRVLPLFRNFWRDAHELHSAALNNAIVFTEFTASVAKAAKDTTYATAYAVGVARAAQDAHAPKTAHDIIYAAVYAAGTVTNTTKATLATTSVSYAAAVCAATTNAAPIISNLIRPIRSDFETVYDMSRASHWTDDSPVPPSVFGPLWPDGPLEGWPKLEQTTTELVFEFDIPDEMTTDEAVAFAKELSAALCSLDLAGGGHGLAIQPPLEITAPAPVPAGSLV